MARSNRSSSPGPAFTRRRFLGASLTAGAGLSFRRHLVAESGSERSATSRPPGGQRPNVVYVMSDQQRRHALGFMNEDPVKTPRTDAFARQSLVCTNACSTSPLCTPFRGSFLSGRYPLSTGVTTNHMNLGTDEPCWGKSLKQAGYQTAYIGKWHVYSTQMGVEQYVPPENRHDFDFWHVANANHDIFWREYYRDSPEPVVNEYGWQPKHEVDVAIEYLREHRRKDAPFALVVSTVPPHNGEVNARSGKPVRLPEEGDRPMKTDFHRNLVYHAPEEYEEPYTREHELERLPNVKGNYARHHCTGYFGGVTAMDHAFGRVLDELEAQGLMENTIVVYSSDHGEMMGSHDLMSKNAPFEESIGIPFVIHWKDRIRPGRDDLLISQVDIAPTLLGLADVPVPVAMEGRDLSGHLLGHNTRKPEDILLNYYSRPNEIEEYGKTGKGWRGVRTPEHSFFYANDYHANLFGEKVAYDLAKDPYQMNPIRPGDSAKGDRLLRDLERRTRDWLVRIDDPWAERLRG